MSNCKVRTKLESPIIKDYIDTEIKRQLDELLKDYRNRLYAILELEK